MVLANNALAGIGCRTLALAAFGPGLVYSSTIMDSANEAIAKARQARREGRFAVAREYYAKAAKSFREQNDVLAYAHAIRHVADIYREEGKRLEAKLLYEEALEIYRSNLGTKLLDLANTVRPYALVNEEQGAADLATKLWEEAKQLYGSLRLEQGVSECEAHILHLQRSTDSGAVLDQSPEKGKL